MNENVIQIIWISLSNKDIFIVFKGIQVYVVSFGFLYMNADTKHNLHMYRDIFHNVKFDLLV
jgi:hypothetical protein